MKELKRSYYLPVTWVDRFDDECQKSGFVRERILAAAVFHFLQSGANNRHDLFMNLDKFLNKRSQ